MTDILLLVVHSFKNNGSPVPLFLRFSNMKKDFAADDNFDDDGEEEDGGVFGR